MKMKNTANRDTAWYGARTACLAEFMTPERNEVLRRTVAMRTRYMTVMAENMYHGQNAAALIRHCEAFGIQEMHTVETLCRFDPNPDIARGTDQWVDVQRHRSTAEALAALRRDGYRIVATTPHREDVTPETFDVTRGPFALVFGTEHAGISDEVIAGADEFLRIPMCGMVESLNVSASAAILIYMLSERVRLTVGDWRMDRRRGRPKCSTGWMTPSVKDAGAISCTENSETDNEYHSHENNFWPTSARPRRPRCWSRSRAPKGRSSTRPKENAITTWSPGVSVSNVGHCNPAVVRAVQEQAARYMHVMVYGELVETPQVEYAAKVASLLPGRVVESRLFRQFGRRSGRRGAQAGQTLYRTHGAGLHAPRLPRVDPRVDEHDGGP